MATRVFLALASVLPAVFTSAPQALARVAQQTDTGFILQQIADVPVVPETAWALLVRPSAWWSAQHSFSLDAANLSLDPRAGGCFCETLPGGDDAATAPRGSVEHMRVVYSEKPRALRMRGALGPLQQDAVTGTLTITLQAVEAGTRVRWEYVVAGFMRARPQDMALATDLVLAEQIGNLARALGASSSAPGAPDTPEEAAAPPDPALGPAAREDPLSDPDFLGR